MVSRKNSSKYILGILLCASLWTSACGLSMTAPNTSMNTQLEMSAEQETSSDGMYDAISSGEIANGINDVQRMEAYATELIRNKQGIEAYNWQYDSVRGESNGARHIAFADVYGDAADELIYITAIGDDHIGTELRICSYIDGEVCTIYQDNWDAQVGGGFFYKLFKVQDGKELYALTSWGDDYYQESYSVFAIGDRALENQTLITYRDMPEYDNIVDGTLMHYQEYYLGEDAISESDYEAAAKAITDKATEVLVFSNRWDSNDALDGIMANGKIGAMNLGESLTYLGYSEDSAGAYAYAEDAASDVEPYRGNGSEWDASLFESSTYDFNSKLAKVCARMSEEAEDNTDYKIQTLYGEYDLWGVKTYNYGGSGAFSFAQDILTINGKDRNVLVITARGTQSDNLAEIAGDYYKGGTDDLCGQKVFDNIYDYEEDIWRELKKYFSEYSYLKTTENLIILVNGHSLGGAAANLTGARIDYEIKNGTFMNPTIQQKDVYVYTFGAIEVLEKEHNVSDGYENIHNIYNRYDSFGPNGNLGNLGVSQPESKFGHTEMFSILKDETGVMVSNSHSMGTYKEALDAYERDPSFLTLKCSSEMGSH